MRDKAPKGGNCEELEGAPTNIGAVEAFWPVDLGNGVMLRKTCSIGFASYPFPPPDTPRPRWEDVAAMADQCLYAAKASARDVWVGIVQRGPVGRMPAGLDVRAGVKDGLFELQHSDGRAIVWPESAAH